MTHAARAAFAVSAAVFLALGSASPVCGQNQPTVVAQPAAIGVPFHGEVSLKTSFIIPTGDTSLGGTRPDLLSTMKVRVTQNGVEIARFAINSGHTDALGANGGISFFHVGKSGADIGASFNSNTGVVDVSINFWGNFNSQGTGTYQIELVMGNVIYVADTDNYSVRLLNPKTFQTMTKQITADGGFVTQSFPSGSAARPQAVVPLKTAKGIAVDGSGVIYVADTGNSVIRRITADGTMAVVAGSIGIAGSLDGIGSHARFLSPTGIAVDTAGNLYVSDVGTATIRKITPDGTVTTLAGTAYKGGSADGTGAAAQFNYPYDLIVDRSGNLFVADSLNETIRKITPAGVVTTFAGKAVQAGSVDGTGAAARFNFPCGLVQDASGNLYVADDINNTIRMITPAGVVTTIAGTAGTAGSADGTGPAARFNYPYGLALDDSGNLLVSDNQNHTLRRVTPAGVVTTIAGSPGAAGNSDSSGSDGSTARFNNPYAVVAGPLAVGAAAGTLSLAATTPVQGRLINLSVLTQAGPSASPLTAGFVVGGSGSKTMLVRAIGPALSTFGVGGVLADPKLQVFSTSGGAKLLATDAGWGGNSQLSAAFSQTGAFALPVGSLDSALLTTVQTGSYTAQVTSASNQVGTALVEVYDADGSGSTARFLNLSTLTTAGSGSAVLTAGFVIFGPNPETILIRGVGPSLAGFGVASFLPDPVLTLHSKYNGADLVIAESENWNDTPGLAAIFSQVGAFALTPGAADTALMTTLPPGNYTVQVSSASNGSGTALIEVYEVGAP